MHGSILLEQARDARQIRMGSVSAETDCESLHKASRRIAMTCGHDRQDQGRTPVCGYDSAAFQAR